MLHKILHTSHSFPNPAHASSDISRINYVYLLHHKNENYFSIKAHKEKRVSKIWFLELNLESDLPQMMSLSLSWWLCTWNLLCLLYPHNNFYHVQWISENLLLLIQVCGKRPYWKEKKNDHNRISRLQAEMFFCWAALYLLLLLLVSLLWNYYYVLEKKKRIYW